MSRSASEIESLVGITEVVPVVFPIDPRVGLSRDQLQSDVESRMQVVGIFVNYDSPDDAPMLTINGLVVPIEGGFVFAFSIEFFQAVTTEAGKARVMARTWSSNRTVTGEDGSSAQFRDALLTNVDEFCSDYLKANPKQDE